MLPARSASPGCRARTPAEPPYARYTVSVCTRARRAGDTARALQRAPGGIARASICGSSKPRLPLPCVRRHHVGDAAECGGCGRAGRSRATTVRTIVCDVPTGRYGGAHAIGQTYGAVSRGRVAVVDACPGAVSLLPADIARSEGSAWRGCDVFARNRRHGVYRHARHSNFRARPRGPGPRVCAARHARRAAFPRASGSHLGSTHVRTCDVGTRPPRAFQPAGIAYPLAAALANAHSRDTKPENFSDLHTT
ncbi:hypothetical protein WOLCODRAFT_151930 [Wolfiporia cocos MD-104 SS10]|uniref:Uncharacterized protein n=1 Tax=Wolfiporia cocos (strain MD-104) TaxID=742152 RepID=A0A2H3JI84_WOLCO|nr:hypothetical protein WOLCODRAFT_151930 [Wolfiporia cocos MD-104 SS10]